jgi:tetratricopeptide (TPR) repeat protein
LALASLIYLAVRFEVLVNPGEALKSSAGSLAERIIYLPGHLLKFISLTLYPANLNADYVYAYPGSFVDFSNLIGTVVVILLVGTAIWGYRYSRETCFSIGWFLVTLFPVYNLIEIYHPLAERYLYLPIVGFCLAVAVGINAAARRLFTNPTTLIWAMLLPAAIIVGLYSYATTRRNPVWQSNFTLWSDTIRKSPDSLVARGGLGMAYLEKGMLQEAARQFEMTIERYPDHHKSYYNLGLVYHRQGDLKKAVAFFNRSIALDPNSVRAHYNLATIYFQQKSWDLAIRHYIQVNELDPEIATAHFNLGMAYANQGKLTSAIAEWEIVLKLDPGNKMARNNILKARKMMERTGE